MGDDHLRRENLAENCIELAQDIFRSVYLESHRAGLKTRKFENADIGKKSKGKS